MRRRFLWMNKASIPMLELLRDTGAALPPSAILVNLNRELDDAPARSTMYAAIGNLEEKGLITLADVSEMDSVDGSYYIITDLGRRFLDEELTEEESERLSVEE